MAGWLPGRSMETLEGPMELTARDSMTPRELVV